MWERFELAQAELNAEVESDPDPGNTNPWQMDRTKKRGYKSPLSNEDKKNKVSQNAINNIITNLLTNKETKSKEDEKGTIQEDAPLPL